MSAAGSMARDGNWSNTGFTSFIREAPGQAWRCHGDPRASEIPVDPSFGPVGAEGSRVDRVLQMAAQVGVNRGDPGDRGSNALRHRLAGAFGGGTRLPGPASQPVGLGQLAGKDVHLRAGPRGPLGV